jgi:hypothetical protein
MHHENLTAVKFTGQSAIEIRRPAGAEHAGQSLLLEKSQSRPDQG